MMAYIFYLHGKAGKGGFYYSKVLVLDIINLDGVLWLNFLSGGGKLCLIFFNIGFKS